jgi:transcriptional regulator with XRE-family HTH domain
MKVIYNKSDWNRGRQLKLAREYRGFTQTKLCKEVEGLSQSNLSNFEGGLKTISQDTLVKIMEVLNFPIHWLDKFTPNFEIDI